MKSIFFKALILLQTISIFSFNAQDIDLEKLKSIATIQPTERQFNWQKLEMTAFFHFGINTFADLEWSDGTQSSKFFNPTQLDCNQWIRSIKKAGFKLAILTVKHHDGFCLWPSKWTEYSVKNSPYKNGKGDVVREFVDACKKEGMKIGIYLSPWDRHEKTYGSDEYNNFFVKQIEELLINYGPVDEFWFDGACGEGPNGKKQIYDWNRYYKIIRKFNTNCVIAVNGPDVRWVGNESGLARDSEWSVVPAATFDEASIGKQFEDFHFEKIDPKDMKNLEIAKPKIDDMAKNLGDFSTVLNAENLVWYPAECDVSIRPGWFYHTSQDKKVKSLKHLVDIYFKSVGRNSVLLLNIPPDTRGLLHENDVARLEEFGSYLKTNFSNNLLKGYTPKITKGTIKENFSNTYEYNLPEAIKFNCLSVAENIETGQRVENFSIHISNDGKKWRKIASATTIGYKRLLKFMPVSATHIKLVIEKSRWIPEISSFQLYKID